MAQLDAHAVELNLEPHHIREAIDAALETNQNTLARHEVKVVRERLTASGEHGFAAHRGDTFPIT